MRALNNILNGIFVFMVMFYLVFVSLTTMEVEMYRPSPEKNLLESILNDRLFNEDVFGGRRGTR